MDRLGASNPLYEVRLWSAFRLAAVRLRHDQRAAAWAFVGVLHLLLFYLILLSLTGGVPLRPGREMQLDLAPGGARVTSGAPPRIDLTSHQDNAIPQPVIVVDDTPPPDAIGATFSAGGPAVTVPAEAIGETHTMPPLSDALHALARKAPLRLLLRVGADGSIVDASIDASSGSAEIDALAVAWVKAHWRYKPALQDGRPIAVATTALVPF